jgi:hypothetical protein
MATPEAWVKAWWNTNKAGCIKTDAARNVTNIFQGGADLAVGAGGVCVAMATYWIKVNLSGTGKGPDSVNMIMKKGLVPASRFFAQRQFFISMRQEKIAAKHGKDLAAVSKQLAGLQTIYPSGDAEQDKEIEKVLDTLLEAIGMVKKATLKEFLGPLAGGANKLTQISADNALSTLDAAALDYFDEDKKAGNYLMVLRASGKDDLGGAHAVAFQIGDGQWEFMDPNSIELECVKPGAMKKFVKEFFAEYYTKGAKPAYATFDLYKYSK